MKRVVRAVVVLVAAAIAGPVLACGFDKTHTTTTSAPAPAATIVKAEKVKAPAAKKVERAKAPAGQAVATRQ